MEREHVMSKRLLVVVLLLSVLCPLSAKDNYQKIYPIDDPSYKTIVDLYRMEALALPSTSGPYSGAELSAMLDRLPYDALTPEAKGWYDAIRRELDGDAGKKSFTGGLSVNEEAYIQTNSTSKFFQGWDNWNRKWADAKPFFSLYSEEHIGSSLYGYFNLSLGVTKTHWSESGDRNFGDRWLWTNTPLLLDNDMKQLDFNMPIRAFVAGGGKHWSFQVGRDRLSWGNGTTGNFILGDHIKYHNMARVAAFDGDFKYTFLVSAFPHPQNYYTSGVGVETKGKGGGQSTYLNGISAFIAHRLEWRTFWDHVGISVSEGVMYMSKDNKIDLMAFAPAMLYHDNYTRSLTNSILGLEMDYTPLRGWNIYGQMVVDEFVLPGEPVPGNVSSGLAEPNGLGFLAGSTYTMKLGKGIFSVNGEYAQTDPYLYLRDGDLQSGTTSRTQEVGQYGINYVVAVREMTQSGGQEYYDEQFLGYKYGGDAQVANLRVSYAVPSRWSVSGNLFFMNHGTFDKWTVWTQVNGAYSNVTTPTSNGSDQKGNQKAGSDYASRDSVSHTLIAGVNGAMEFGHGFSAMAQCDYIMIVNPGNISSNGTVHDVQLTIGVGYTL
jgi:hypothetical protein